MSRISYRFLVPGWSAKPLVSAHDRILGTHTPHTNGVIERWFEALKYERLYREDIADGIDLAEHVAAFTDEYNRVRPHEALHWQRPLDAHLSTTTLKPNPPGTEQGT